MGVKPTDFRLAAFGELTDDTEIYTQKLDGVGAAADAKFTLGDLKSYVALSSIQRHVEDLGVVSGTNILQLPPGVPTMPADASLYDIIMDDGDQSFGITIDALNRRITLPFSADGESFIVKYFYA